MKTKKCLLLALSLVLLLSALAGCGAAESLDYAMDSNAGYGKPESSYETGIESPMEPGVATGGDLSATAAQQKLIKTVYMTTETEDMDALLPLLDAKIGELGGYVEARKLENGSSYTSSNRTRWASLTIRIPAENLDKMVSGVQGSSNVTEYNETVDDVTASYVDIESRRKALETEQARLLELMEKAENLSDLLTIEERLTEVRYQLESITSQLRVYDNQIAYSTIFLSIREVREYTPVKEETVWERISGGFMDSLEGLGNGLLNFLIFILAASPYLVFIALLAVGLVLVIRLAGGKKGKKKGRTPEEPKADL